MADLITIARLSALRKVPEDSEAQTRAAACISAASEWFEGRVGPISAADITVRLSGNGGRVLRGLPRKPINSVSSLTVDGATWAVLDTGADTGQQALISPSRAWLEARYGVWTYGVGNILLTYNGGYATIPAAIQQVVAMVAWLCMEETNRLGITAKSLGPEQVNMIARNSDDYQFIKQVIDDYGGIW